MPATSVGRLPHVAARRLAVLRCPRVLAMGIFLAAASFVDLAVALPLILRQGPQQIAAGSSGSGDTAPASA